MLRPILFLLLATVALDAAAEEKGAAALSLLKAIDDGFVQVYEKVAPTVVVIEASKPGEDQERQDAKSFEFFFKNGEPQRDLPKSPETPPNWRLPTRSEGSGFIVRADGLILTNNHVIADAERLSVRLKDGRSFPAKVLGTDDKTDIAVLQIDAKNLPVVEFGNSDALRIGQLVCAIGAPFNQDYSFTAGWVSGKGRTDLLSPTSRTIIYEDYIQTDAFINPGNSGGPLFDVEGKVVGMNTLINGIGRGLAFAIPSSMLQEISGILIARGKVQRPYLGIRIETLGKDPSLREHTAGVARGVVVDTIDSDAPAYRSDLRAADVIIAVDGAAIASARELQKEILKKKIGQVVQLTVWRNGTTLEIPVATGELPSEITKVANQIAPPEKPMGNGETLGLKLRDAEGTRGAIVLEIGPDSPASKADIVAGDLITAVDTQPISSAAAAVKAMESSVIHRDQRGVLLNLERKGKRTFVVLKSNP